MPERPSRPSSWSGSRRSTSATSSIDLGGDGSDPNDDYPDFSLRLGIAVRDGDADRGILICGSGVGAAIAASKMRGVRAAVCHDTYSARQGVEHDDMNVLVLGSRVIGPEPAIECARAFLGARVQRRGAARPATRQGAGDRGGRIGGRRDRRGDRRRAGVGGRADHGLRGTGRGGPAVGRAGAGHVVPPYSSEACS